MTRMFVLLLVAATILITEGCGGGGSAGSGTSVTVGGVGSAAVPALSGIAPSSAVVGASTLTLVAYGSNLQDGAVIQWNGVELATSACVDVNLIQILCSMAAAVTATIPASDFATAGTAKVTLKGTFGGTSQALSFTIVQPSSGNTWVRAVAGISAPNGIVSDTARGKVYVSLGATDADNPNTIAVIDPIAGSATSFAPAGNNPNLLSISSDNAYLWVGLDGSSSVQRLLLPGLNPDISFTLPVDPFGNLQRAVSLQAAPINPHTVGMVVGIVDGEGGDAVYVYDDATARSNYVPRSGGGGAIDWIQWGADDLTIYGNTQPLSSDAGGISTLSIDSSGVTLSGYGGGPDLLPTVTQFDKSNGVLYSNGRAYDPVKVSLTASFGLVLGSTNACTADSGLGRYYCGISYNIGGTDVLLYELWVFDLNSYALLNRVFFGFSSGSQMSIVSGSPRSLVRWGAAGLALLTDRGVFLIDGAAVNPGATPDVTKGAPEPSYAWLSSMTPDSANTTSGQVQVTVRGNGFSPDSTACWNCQYLQDRFLPTTFVSSTQLNVTVPLSDVSSTAPLEVSVFDQSSNLYSTNALTFTVLGSSGTTQVTPLNICGLAAVWDKSSQLLYVATADYDGAYPNSVLAMDPTTGNVVQSRSVESDPAFLSDSADGEYLYVAYASATNLTQLTLPGLNTTATAALQSQGNTFFPGDLKAAPQNPHTVAATLLSSERVPEAVGGIVIFQDGTALPDSLPGFGQAGQTVSALYDVLAWSASDQLLTSAASSVDANSSPLYLLQVDSSGVSYIGQGSTAFNTPGDIHSDFGTNLIYSDGGSVINPSTGVIVGSYGASGLMAPDSSLNRVFILGQTTAQANMNSYTIQSFDQKAFNLVSSITLANVSGTPIELVRWGATGLAVLTTGGVAEQSENGNGMLYLIQDSTFVSSTEPAARLGHPVTERVRQRWRRMTIKEYVSAAHRVKPGGPSQRQR